MCVVCNERTNETIKRKKEKNNKKNDRLRSGDRTRAYSGHSREFRDDERDEEEIGRLARMGERFKGTSSSSSSPSFFFVNLLFLKNLARVNDGTMDDFEQLERRKENVHHHHQPILPARLLRKR